VYTQTIPSKMNLHNIGDTYTF